MACPDSQEACIAKQLPATTDASHDFSLDDTMQEGAKVSKALQGARKEKKYSKDMLSDRDLERLSLLLQSDTEDDQQTVAKAIEEEHRKRFQRYKHYYFEHHWKPRSSGAQLDDEWFIPNPEVLPEDDPGHLCEKCRHLNFEVLFTQRGLPGNSVPSMPTRIDFDSLWEVMQEEAEKCAFCGLLRRKIIEDGNVDRMKDHDFRKVGFYINVIDEGPEYQLRLEIELEFPEATTERFVVQRIEENPQQPLGGRVVQQDRADMDQLRQWLHICENTHQFTQESLGSNLASLRVIDTEECRVREVAYPFRYACLSYVWGKGSQVQYTTATKGRMEVPNGLQVFTLPQTIKDAIKAAREAGLRYLWVDALCILQDDPEDKDKIILEMGTIYGGATLTIVASAHADPYQGLPGMGTAHRSVAQDVAEVQGMTLAVCLHDPRQLILDIESSVWSSRAWTFQEQALSPRSVHFTRSQMAFKCVHSAVMLEETVATPDPTFKHSAIKDQNESDLMHLIWAHPSLGRFAEKGFSGRNAAATIMSGREIDLEAFEGQEIDIESLMSTSKVPVFDIIVDAPRDFMDSLAGIDELTPWDLYRRAVDDYTKRTLSFESDAVKAFAGVEQLVGRGINAKFWFGLPSFAFEQALLWHARAPLERRAQNNHAIYPSWSWAAWRGQVSYRGRGWKNSILWDPVPVVRWFITESQQWFVDKFKEGGEKTEEEIRDYEKKVAGAELLLRELDPYSLRFLNTRGQDGWVVNRDEDCNRHIYSHDDYPGVKFSYPVNLPGQKIDFRPVMRGALMFYAHVVPIVSCDMKKTAFKMKIEDRFMQLGINDEDCSANYRPPWRRIVYHQGYRAGFLTLNDETVPAEGDDCKYHLAAITRGSLPHVPPPPPGWDAYWGLEPREVQAIVLDEEWKSGPSKLNVPGPQETVEPSTRPQNEDGDPHWDYARFNAMAICDVYDVLVLMTRKGMSQRIGAGKISYCAFSAACPEKMFVKLI